MRFHSVICFHIPTKSFFWGEVDWKQRVHLSSIGHSSLLRVLKRLGVIPPFVRRARYIRANLSEDCYVSSRVLQLKTRNLGTFIRIVWTMIWKVSGTKFISTQIYSKTKLLILYSWFYATYKYIVSILFFSLKYMDFDGTTEWLLYTLWPSALLQKFTTMKFNLIYKNKKIRL
jgi:hypothetical protein